MRPKKLTITSVAIYETSSGNRRVSPSSSRRSTKNTMRRISHDEVHEIRVREAEETVNDLNVTYLGMLKAKEYSDCV